jgi:hypothetical protein
MVGEDNPSFGRRKLQLSRSALKRLKKLYVNNDIIAEKLGVCENSVIKAMTEANIWYKNARTEKTKIPRDLLVSLYQKGFDLKRIGKILNVDDGAIARTFRQYGIEYNVSRGWKRSSVSLSSLKSGTLSSLKREAEFKWETGLRAKIRERDEYSCFICKKKEDGSAHHVHHIFYDVAYSDARHLVTLCHNCHMKTNRGSKIVKALWIDYFAKRLSEAYGYVYDDMIEGGGRVGKVIASTD